jgi:PPP family 3-phenylpropionic acid transporter
VFPVHLTQNLGVSPRWLGLISSFGVAVEVPLIFGLGWLTMRFGLKRVVIFGAVASLLRLGVLALAPNATTAIATQVLHGVVVVGTMVAPVVFVNHLGGDGFRNSMQGVLAVAVTGPFKFLGPLVNGWLAQHDARWAFAFAATLAGLAAILLWRLVPDAPE